MKVMPQVYDGERRLTEEQRPLTSPPTLNDVAQSFGHGKHPLPYRHVRDDTVDQVSRRLRHAASAARGAEPAALAAEGQQLVVAALATDR